MPAPKEITLAAMIGSIRLYVCQPEPPSRSPRISNYAFVTIVWDVADRWRRNLFSPGRCEHIPGASLCQNFLRCLHSFPIVAMH
jgi:hypothetical protein